MKYEVISLSPTHAKLTCKGVSSKKVVKAVISCLDFINTRQSEYKYYHVWSYNRISNDAYTVLLVNNNYFDRS